VAALSEGGPAPAADSGSEGALAAVAAQSDGERAGATVSAGDALTWRSWPAAERPGQAVVVAVAILAASFGLGMYWGDPVLGGIAFAILTLSLAAFFFPTRYRIDGTGVEATSVFGARRREWSVLRSYVADARGVTVSPFARASWLESYRGLRLLYSGPAGNRDAVVAAVAERLAAMGERKAR